jgi:CDP-paratose 2-epimerase
MPSNPRILITGGAGFIGANAAAHFKAQGFDVRCVDNFSRRGAADNAIWLRDEHQVESRHVDLRDAEGTRVAFADFQPDMVLHAAAQVAVTTSVVDPRRDFEDNALATFNVLEASRVLEPKPLVLYTSTNKVYGGMEDVEVVEKERRYEYVDLPMGAPESRPLDFHSPYGCSKGAADQYVHDYHRIYGLPTVVFRQSCIYGQRQFGIEDQGWVAWFSIRAAQRKGVSIFGDGKQVRDVLHVDDLCRAFHAAWEKRADVAGGVFNMGGGPENTMSLLELLDYLEEVSGAPLEHKFDDWRPGDQRVFIADTRLAQSALGWRAEINPRAGVEKLYGWIQEHITLVG